MANQNGHHEHYILPDRKAIKTGVALLVLTLITVWVAGIDMGRFNFTVAMIVATIKALLVVSIFMNLAHDTRQNSMIFGSSFIFLAIFITFGYIDLFFRGDVYVKGPLMSEVAGKSKFKKAWEPTPELVAHGKTTFAAQCSACHGNEGKGDGPAAAALNPHPRNFTVDGGWKIGRKPSQIFKTLKEGIPGSGMASFATLPADTRWALAHYVGSLGPSILKDETKDLMAVGVDPSKEESAVAEAKTVPVDIAMKHMAEEQARDGQKGNLQSGAPEYDHYDKVLQNR